MHMEEGMENKEFVIVVDFGGQYNQLIARRVRENHVYCEVYPYNKALEKIKELKPQGIIFTGGRKRKVNGKGGRAWTIRQEKSLDL